MSNFIQDYLAGNTSLEAIDDYIDEWHESDSDQPIYTFLGMTREEYAAWVANSQVLLYIVKAHKEHISYNEAIAQAA